MANNWTKDQQNAISARGGNLLVSAAAGSGKTSVLVQRVIERITDKKNPTDITELLIVTFTKAAAREMKSRIADKLSEYIAAHPESTNLYRQQMLLKTAHIGTIDSFCNTLVRDNFFELGISPDFRISDEYETAVIKQTALESTLNYFFELKNPDFLMAADLFAGEKNDKELGNIIEQIYDFTRTLPFPEKWMDSTLRLYKQAAKDGDVSVWENIINQNTKEALSLAKELLKQAISAAKNSQKANEAYGSSLHEDLISLENIISKINSNESESFKAFIDAFEFCKLKPLKGEEALKADIKAKRDYAKGIIASIKDCYRDTTQKIKNDANIIYKVVSALFNAVKYFSEEAESIKLSKNSADFSDIEHRALKLLCAVDDLGNTIKSSLAEEITQRYAEIMVDEYQDINDIQDMIFKMISKPSGNLFMVGDVKQSIYGFRRSRPQIFLQKKNLYKSYNPESPKYPAKISLGQNFRSKKGILESVNFLFENMMSLESGEIEYNSEEALLPGAKYLPTDEPDTVFKFLDASDPGQDDCETEVQTIAAEIIKMISGGYMVFEKGKERPATYGDFCILLRSANNNAPIYAQKLFECGIPVSVETSENFLSTKEISTVISLLEAINNPSQDVHLIASMISPFFGFTPDELSSIRACDTDVPFYFSCKKYLEKNSDEKLKNFMESISLYRTLAATTPCNELIEQIYNDTEYPSLCLSVTGGELKKNNLLLLEDYAKEFERSTHGGISGFLSYINSIKSRGADLPAATFSSGAENAVKIMSIHKSKGLEFPVCILARCSHGSSSNSGQIVIHPELGVGMKLKNSDGTVKYDNFIRHAIILKNERENTAEELRVLYVALTRAKQKLIIISSLKNPAQSISKSILLSGTDVKISPYTIRHSKCFTDWILLCIARSGAKNKLYKFADLTISAPESEPLSQSVCFAVEYTSAEPGCAEPENSNEPKSTNIITKKTINARLPDEILNRLNFIYPYGDLTDLPLKMSASDLAAMQFKQEYIASSVPEFLSGTHMSAAHRGTAMHKFMCCADLTNALNVGINEESAALEKNGFLTHEEARALDISALKKLINSQIAGRMLKSTELLREYRFSVNIPADILLPNKFLNKKSPHLIMVQGALDCAFKEDESYIIIDYKTDRVSKACELFEKYKEQLRVYKYALENIKGLPVKALGVYSFYLGEYYEKSFSPKPHQ